MEHAGPALDPHDGAGGEGEVAMRFTIEPADHVISLEQHQDDVHICLNGELVAWFSFTGLFSFSSNYLKQQGIKVTAGHKGGGYQCQI